MAFKKDKTEEGKQQNPTSAEEVELEVAESPAEPESAPPGDQPEPEQQPAPEKEEPTADPKLQGQLKEAEDRNLRLMAEFDNFRRRTLKEKESIYPDAVAETIKALLPVLDNFQRAMEAPCNDEEYRKGVEMTYNGFMEVLHKMGLLEFAQAGEAFDANLHNAVMHIEDEKLEKNVISQVFQRGYRIGDTVLRYAMVQTAN